MKHLISSVTIGACLLLSSAGHVFAQPATNNPHGSAVAGVGGQLGTGSSTGVAGCLPGTTKGSQPSPPGQTANTTPTSSPFPNGSGTTPSPNYAGQGLGTNPNANGHPAYGPSNPNAMGTPNVNSQYDNACYRAGLRAGTVQVP
jgi:hypothetical protein